MQYQLHMKFSVLVLVIHSGLVAFAESPQDNFWPQWRGPQRNGLIADTKWPEDLSEKHLSKSWSIAPFRVVKSLFGN